MDIFAQYATDPKLEQEGKPFPWGGGLTLILARAGNIKYNRLITSLYEAHKHTLDLKDTPEQIEAGINRTRLIMAEVLAKSVLLGWEGEMTVKGEPLPYSVANAQKLLEIKDFQDAVASKAGDFKNYRFAVEEADAKNSSTTSSGTSLGDTTLTISKE
jgi:hypothetical protein